MLLGLSEQRAKATSGYEGDEDLKACQHAKGANDPSRAVLPNTRAFCSSPLI